MPALIASSRGERADVLRAGHQDFVRDEQLLELVEEAREIVDDLARLAPASPAADRTRQPPKRM